MQRNSNRGLLDAARFKPLDAKKADYLRKLSVEDAIRILESLTSPETLNEFIPFFSHDQPVCLKVALKHELPS